VLHPSTETARKDSKYTLALGINNHGVITGGYGSDTDYVTNTGLVRTR
jgi:hypothetical protein